MSSLGAAIVREYQRGVVFRLGKVRGVRGPGLHFMIPLVDRLQKVNMQTVAMGVPGQDGITSDNVSVRVDAVVYFRVIDPGKAIVKVSVTARGLDHVPGKVFIRVGKWTRTVTLVDGRAEVRVARTPGRKYVAVRYLETTVVPPASLVTSVRVR